MKLDKQSNLWIIMVIFLGILVGSLMIYLGDTKQADSYDMELLKSNLDDELQPSEAMPDDGTSGQDVILYKGITAGSSYSEELVAEGSKTILFLGEDKGNTLYDAIGLVSIDSKNKKVSIIMLPRDMYVDYSKSVRDALQAAGKANVAGIYKLNATHYIGAMIGYKGKFKANSISFLAQVIKEKFGIDVDDYVKINTEGFKQVVDLFGGVDINVPYNMNYDDPAQELFIHLTKGEHHLDGKQAEGFVRFRKGYRADGTKFDVDRKKNQLAFLNAFIKQNGTISNINKIPGLLKTLDRNITHSIDFGDMLLTYTGLAKDVINDKYVIEDKNINGEDEMINGVSYVIVR
ncbi:MAG: hypothetical protein APF77_19895 [Clostridia bacterium BRH_c25]|nr:MAG: hypothetical protein APF77_19895 [Clostridia bacterium BRH_c25]